MGAAVGREVRPLENHLFAEHVATCNPKEDSAMSTPINMLSLAWMTVFAAAAIAQDRPPVTASRADMGNRTVQPRATEPPVRSRMVRLADGTGGELADVPTQQNNALVAERGPDGRYRVRHAGDHASDAAAVAEEVAR